MDEQMVLYPYNVVLLSHEKERSTDTHYIDEFWTHYAECKKPDRKGHIWFHLYEISITGQSIEINNK